MAQASFIGAQQRYHLPLFFLTQIKRYDSNFSLLYSFFKQASISFILSWGNRPYAYILIKVNTN